METPIHVSVRAETSIGPGEPSTITFFTKEGGEHRVYMMNMINFIGTCVCDTISAQNSPNRQAKECESSLGQ